MFSVLRNPTYCRMFVAQLVTLLGTGLATVALSLFAFELAGSSAALVLGIALTIKMLAYVTVAPIATAYCDRFNRRSVLIALNLVRAVMAACLPFVTEVWQIFAVIFLLQSASAAYTPSYQAAIPDVLEDESEYTKALSLSRLTVDLENILSPSIAAFLLVFVSFNFLFWGTALSYVAAALILFSLVIPAMVRSNPRPVYDGIKRGLKIYLKTPRLRGLLALSWVASSLGAMVIVNSVAIIRGQLSMSESSLGIALTTFGAGSMLSAILLPKTLSVFSDRIVMLCGASLGIASLAALSFYVALFELEFSYLLVAWFTIAVGYSAILTPSGRLLTRSAHSEDRPALFATHFALSHACWLLAYPLAGVAFTYAGALPTMVVLYISAFLGFIIACWVWPAAEYGAVEHRHPNLPLDHPHLKGNSIHRHEIVIDELHPRIESWP